MKAYANLNGKAQWGKFWGDIKVPKKIKRSFKKSARQAGKKQTV